MAVTVLVLQAFAGERGAPGRAAEHKSPAAHVRSGPDEVRDALETEHRIENEEWNRVDAMRGVGGASGDKGAHGARFGDSLFENLAVLCFLVIEQRVDIHGLVFLPDTGVDAHGAEERFHAEGARLVRHNGHDELADLRILQHLSQHGDESHGGRDLAALAAAEEFREEIVVVRANGLRAHAPLGYIAAQRLATRAKVLNFLAILRRAVEGHLEAVLIAQRNAESRAEFQQLFFVQLLLLVRDVLAFARFAKSIALDGARENNGRRARVLDSDLVRGIDLLWIMATQAETLQRLIGKRLDGVEETRVSAKKRLPDVRPRRNNDLLIFTVHQLTHALDEEAFRVALENRIPLASPENLDDVPAGAAEGRLQLLDDLAVAANRPVQALQVAVDDKDQVVEFFARGERDGSQRLRLISFAVADKGPNLRVGDWLEAAVFEIPIEARLIDGHQRAQAHGNRRKLPEVRHQPGMRIGGEAAAGLQFAAKIFELLQSEASFEKGPSVNAGRRVALKIDRVTFEALTSRAEEVIESDLVQSGSGSEGGDVAADGVLDTVRADHHCQGVPSHQAFDPPLELLIPREQWLEAPRNGVGIRRIGGERQGDAGDRRVGAQALQNVHGHFRAARFEDRIEGFEPLLNLDLLHARRMGRRLVVHEFAVPLLASPPGNFPTGHFGSTPSTK